MISVKILADSTFLGRRVTTYELEYPRYIHAELMTHRVFSRNAASSRAIPIEKMIELVRDNTVLPIWTENQAGMQGRRITNGKRINELNQIWIDGAEYAICTAELLLAAGAHKQNANRVLEPFQHIKVILTGSDFDNWFALRDHPDAQPEIRALAREMRAEMDGSKPDKLDAGWWHLPYVEWGTDKENNQIFFSNGAEITLEEAKMISASCCAQVSYRRNDDSLAKAKLVYARLVDSTPLHASPFEHQVRPAHIAQNTRGNLVGWYQLRQEIEDDRV